MSHAPADEDDVDIWEFVSCSKCHLPFSPEPSAPPPVPFWLTECGHIICNNHLSADQRCVACGQQRVQMVPLQREMEKPMMDWFQPVSHGLDSIAHAMKFQQDMLASLVRYYKGKCIQQRHLVDRIKNEVAEAKILRKTVEELRAENDELRQYAGLARGTPSDMPNMNGKRRMTDAYRVHGDTRPYSSSSSAAIPMGPNRLTLPPSHQQPNFVNRGSEDRESNGSNGAAFAAQSNRPGSSRFTQQFAYIPPQTSQNHGHEPVQPQGTPQRMRSAVAMPPPPTPANQGGSQRFRPSGMPSSNTPVLSSINRTVSNASRSAQTLQTPSRSHNASAGSSANALLQPAMSSNRFAPRGSTSSSNQQYIPQTPSGGPRRFVPPASSSKSRAPSRTAGTPALGHGHRSSFVPGAQFG